MLDVEASEVSDDVNSNAGSKSRGLVRVSIPCSSIMSDHTDTSAIAFKCVGEEEAEVPEAPLEYSKKMGIGQAWAVFDDKIRKLQAEIDVLKDEKTEIHRANTDLKIRNNELEALLQSFSLRSTHTTAEVDSLTRQLKDNRGAHARRIKELESQLEKEKLTYSDDLDKQRSIQRRLKAEIDMLRDSKVGFTKGRSSPALPTRKERAVPLPRTSSKRDVNGRPLLVDELVTRAQKVNFSRTKSAGSVHDRPRRRSERSDRLSSSARQTVAQKKLLPASVSSDGGTSCSSRTRARRSLIRRAFIAHIHSNKYRSTKSAWVEFLGGENGHVSPDQFARAVRGLAVASNARDRDLGLLREEVCGAELCDTGVVTWGMFARFCQETRGEPT